MDHVPTNSKKHASCSLRKVFKIYRQINQYETQQKRITILDLEEIPLLIYQSSSSSYSTLTLSSSPLSHIYKQRDHIPFHVGKQLQRTVKT